MERGRVQEIELIDHFLSDLGGNEQSEEGVDREVFERAVESVASMKVEDGVKFVCLNSEESVMCADAECNGNIPQPVDNGVNGNPDNGEQTGDTAVLVCDYNVQCWFYTTDYFPL